MWYPTHGCLFFVTKFELLWLEIFMCNSTDETRLPHDHLSHTYAKQRGNFNSGSPSIARSPVL